MRVRRILLSLFALVFLADFAAAGAGMGMEELAAWKVSIFLFAFLVVSFAVEHYLHKIHHKWVHEHRNGLVFTLAKIKDELMLMGFISLTLVMTEDILFSWCIGPTWSGVPLMRDTCAIKCKDNKLSQILHCGPGCSIEDDFMGVCVNGDDYGLVTSTNEARPVATHCPVMNFSASTSNNSYDNVRRRLLSPRFVNSAGSELGGPGRELGSKSAELKIPTCWEYNAKQNSQRQRAGAAEDGAEGKQQCSMSCACMPKAAEKVTKSEAKKARRLAGNAAYCKSSFKTDAGRGVGKCVVHIPASTAARRSAANTTQRRLVAASVTSSLPKVPVHQRRLGAAGPQCCFGEAFIDATALHEVHFLIFILATFHICYTCIIMYIATKKVEVWKPWEMWGDSKEERSSFSESDVMLERPQEYKNCCTRVGCSAIRSITHQVDPFTFIALRRYYITRHKLDKTFDFHSMVSIELEHDFAELVGIKSWMWLILIANVIMEGYILSRGLILIGIVGVSFAVGTKLQLIAGKMALQIYDRFDKDHDHHISRRELTEIQDTLSNESLDDIEPDFWCDRPKLLRFLTQAVMWANSQNIALFFFYAVVVGGEKSCYIQSRGYPLLWTQLAVSIVIMLHQAYIIVPMYSLCLHVNSHREDWMQRLLDMPTAQAKSIVGKVGKVGEVAKFGVVDGMHKMGHGLHDMGHGVTKIGHQVTQRVRRGSVHPSHRRMKAKELGVSTNPISASNPPEPQPAKLELSCNNGGTLESKTQQVSVSTSSNPAEVLSSRSVGDLVETNLE